MRYKTILLFGAPGSGKGTQGKILGAIPGFFHTACGDIFRSLDLSSEMGRIAWEYSWLSSTVRSVISAPSIPAPDNASQKRFNPKRKTGFQ